MGSFVVSGWLNLEYLPLWKAVGLWGLLCLPIVWMGIRSMAGLGPVRRWVALGVRLLLLLVLILMLAGPRWTRKHKSVEVWILRDISQSVKLAETGKSGIYKDIEDYIKLAADKSHKIDPQDNVGVISFSDSALIDSLLNLELSLDAKALRSPGNQTNLAESIQLALATYTGKGMKRMLIISDGNSNAGDLDTALTAAAAQHVPIDVMPLRYDVKNEVIVEKISAPSFKRENDAFEISVSLLSTNTKPVTGTLRVTSEGADLESEPRKVTIQGAEVTDDGTIEPRKHVERVRIPALGQRGVMRFKAVFTPDVVNDRSKVAAGVSQPGDTLSQNNSAGAFTFVQGKSRVLYVDNTLGGAGTILANALKQAGINIIPASIEDIPGDPVEYQQYDAIVLNNVPRGIGGVSLEQDKMLASYVHDFGGGLIMIGGENSMGAGGWQNSEVEKVMPVLFDIPAQRQMKKGALVIVVHACEMPDGNYWGEQCAIKAVETLSSMDEVGVISYDMGMPGPGGAKKPGIQGAAWDFVLGPKRDGSGVFNAIKQMQPGDMPDFNATLQLALNGVSGTSPCLMNSSAAVKRIIIISDGDPQPPAPALIKQCKDKNIGISTITVYPHQMGAASSTMQRMAEETGGKFYGPIENNPSQLPQIFIKEATVVRRTLIQEPNVGDPPYSVFVRDNMSDIMKGIVDAPEIEGLVLSQKKNAPGIEMPMVITSGGKTDPLFAHWQSGLGRTAVFASDASTKWQKRWLSDNYKGQYAKFWAQMVRGVSRPPMSTDLSVTTTRDGDMAKVTVEMTDNKAGFTNFSRIQGSVIDANGKNQPLTLTQTGPGTYTGQFAVPESGNYVAALQYTTPEGKAGWAATGISVNESAETRELHSNEIMLTEIARRTNGRVLKPFDPVSADIYSRNNVLVGAAPLPILNILLVMSMILMIIDVAVRRIAWDWLATKRVVGIGVNWVKSHTTTRKVQSDATLGALKKKREDVDAKMDGKDKDGKTPPPMPSVKRDSDRSAKFEAREEVAGDISKLVGGAADKPIPSAPKDPKPKGAVNQEEGHTGSLMEAKRRARIEIEKKQKGL